MILTLLAASPRPGTCWVSRCSITSSSATVATHDAGGHETGRLHARGHSVHDGSSLLSGVRHCDRKAMIGCTRDARRAGRYVASRVTAPRTIATAAYVTGSVGATPYRSADIIGVTRVATPIPSPRPASVSASPCRKEQRAHVAALCTKRHPDPDFVRPFCGNV